MRIVVISDTHGKHDELGLLYGDVLIHCGDMCNAFGQNVQDIANLDNWFGKQKFQRIFCVGGNHDFVLQQGSKVGKVEFQNAIYLQDQSYQYQGVNFFGSPWVPEISEWAFYLDDKALEEKWSQIPDRTNVLITHTPPHGILDRNSSGKCCGCPELFKRVQKLCPRLHCFGHIHASFGVTEFNGTTFLNASIVNRRYQIIQKPHVYNF
jgi:Icc-related predicted phosphoesterase